MVSLGILSFSFWLLMSSDEEVVKHNYLLLVIHSLTLALSQRERKPIFERRIECLKSSRYTERAILPAFSVSPFLRFPDSAGRGGRAATRVYTSAPRFPRS